MVVVFPEPRKPLNTANFFMRDASSLFKTNYRSGINIAHAPKKAIVKSFSTRYDRFMKKQEGYAMNVYQEILSKLEAGEAVALETRFHGESGVMAEDMTCALVPVVPEADAKGRLCAQVTLREADSTLIVLPPLLRHQRPAAGRTPFACSQSRR